MKAGGVVAAKKDEPDLMDIDVNLPLSKTRTVSEFFLVSMCRHLEINQKQAIALLTDNSKYLAHILAKGLKGIFEPIILWFQEMNENLPQLFMLCELDRKASSNNYTDIVRVLNDCKGGLLSRSHEVVEKVSKFFIDIGHELYIRNKGKICYNWFVSDKGGLYHALLSLRRQPDVRLQVVEFVVTYAKHSLFDCLTLQLTKAVTDSFDILRTISDVLTPLVQYNKMTDEVPKFIAIHMT
jgi:hypothetical protein